MQNNKKNNDYSRLVLREAAGCFWLVDTAQSGRPYRPPLRINSSGAEIWTALACGKTPEEIAEDMAEPGVVTAEEILADIREFVALTEQQAHL